MICSKAPGCLSKKNSLQSESNSSASRGFFLAMEYRRVLGTEYRVARYVSCRMPPTLNTYFCSFLRPTLAPPMFLRLLRNERAATINTHFHAQFFSILARIVWTCKNLARIVWTCKNLARIVWTCKNLARIV